MFSLWTASSFTSRNIDSAPLALVLMLIHYWVALRASQENRPKFAAPVLLTFLLPGRCAGQFGSPVRPDKVPLRRLRTDNLPGHSMQSCSSERTIMSFVLARLGRIFFAISIGVFGIQDLMQGKWKGGIPPVPP